jgi:hypothetical protein
MDIREKTAKYYDLWSLPYDDITFYLDHIKYVVSGLHNSHKAWFALRYEYPLNGPKDMMNLKNYIGSIPY